MCTCELLSTAFRISFSGGGSIQLHFCALNHFELLLTLYEKLYTHDVIHWGKFFIRLSIKGQSGSSSKYHWLFSVPEFKMVQWWGRRNWERYTKHVNGALAGACSTSQGVRLRGHGGGSRAGQGVFRVWSLAALEASDPEPVMDLPGVQWPYPLEADWTNRGVGYTQTVAPWSPLIYIEYPRNFMMMEMETERCAIYAVENVQIPGFIEMHRRYAAERKSFGKTTAHSHFQKDKCALTNH